MKLWKIMLATLIATLLVCGCVAMADECTHPNAYLDIPKQVDYPCQGVTITPRACPDCDAELPPHVINYEGGHTIVTKPVTKADCASFAHKVSAYNQCSVCGEITYKAEKVDYDADVAYKPNGCGVEGNNAHKKCSICDATKDKVVYPKLTHDYALEVGYTAPTCEFPGERVMACNVQNVEHAYCGDLKYIELPKVGHSNSNDWRVVEPATCTEIGREASTCTWCFAQAFYRDIPAKGHNFYTAKEILQDANRAYRNQWPTCTADGWAYAQCKNGCVADQFVVLAALGHDMSDWTVADYDCVKGAVGTRDCERPGCTLQAETKVFVAPEGHKWVVNGGKLPTCTEPGAVNNKCSVCGWLEYNVYAPATGHKNAKETARVEPKCGVAGSVTVTCDDCKKTVTEAIPALAHAYSWVTTPATPSANGKSEYKCSLCGDVAETKTVKYSKYYYNNTMTSFGPTTRELVGGNDWYRVTPVDVTVDGVYTYDLIASNKYVVGSVTISVNAGTLSVSYKVGNNVDVADESLLIYASKADLAAGTAVTAPVGAAINVAETFGADSKVLVSLILTGAYDAAGKSIVDEAAASSMIANID